MRGNCLLYALGMLLAEGFTGRIEARLAFGCPAKWRFYYVAANGATTCFYPRHPRTGARACFHALWFEGRVKKKN